VIQIIIAKANGLRSVRVVFRDKSSEDYWFKGTSSFRRDRGTQGVIFEDFSLSGSDAPHLKYLRDYKDVDWISAETFVDEFKENGQTFLEFVDPPSAAARPATLAPRKDRGDIRRALIYSGSRLPYSLEEGGLVYRFRSLPPNPGLSLPEYFNETELLNQKFLRENTVDTPAR
jgi:hypothetical protein